MSTYYRNDATPASLHNETKAVQRLRDAVWSAVLELKRQEKDDLCRPDLQKVRADLLEALLSFEVNGPRDCTAGGSR